MCDGLHGKYICGNSHSSKRGGEPIDNIPYGTWMNNCGRLFDNPTNADAGWLSTGDYDVAFRNKSGNKTFNIFLCGGHSEPSWKSTLIGGAIGLGIQGLGLWGMSKLFGRKKDTNVGQPQVHPMTSYWNSYFSNWKMPSWNLGTTIGSSSTQSPTQQKPPEQQTKPIDENKAVDNNSKPPATTPTANFTNSKIKVDGIKGDVKRISYQGSTSGYPTSFEIHDSSLNHSQKKDEKKEILADIYHFELQNDDKLQSGEATYPQYKCVKAELYVQNKNDVTFNSNTFVINNGFSAEKNNDGHYTIRTSNNAKLGGTTDSSQPTVKNKVKINYDNGTKTIYSSSES